MSRLIGTMAAEAPKPISPLLRHTSAELSVGRMGIHRESYYAYLPPSQIIAGKMEAIVRA